MLWGSFFGKMAGLCVFWENNWGKMNAESYCQRILPQVVDFLRSNPGTAQDSSEFVLDNATAHTATVTKDYLRDHGIITMKWPPYSPDLNPIENVWSHMKSCIYFWYGDSDGGRQRRRNEIRPIVQEAWNLCTQPHTLMIIHHGMQRSCEEVISIGGLTCH